jgi:hypothetical protein
VARRVSATRTYTDTQRARDHVLPYWRVRRLCDIRPSDVDDWIAKLSTKMGGESVRHCYTLFRGPVRRAVRDGIITDPLIDIVTRQLSGFWTATAAPAGSTRGSVGRPMAEVRMMCAAG